MQKGERTILDTPVNMDESAWHDAERFWMLVRGACCFMMARDPSDIEAMKRAMLALTDTRIGH